MYACTQVRMYACMPCTHVRMYACTPCTHVRMYASVHVRVYERTHVCKRASMAGMAGMASMTSTSLASMASMAGIAGITSAASMELTVLRRVPFELEPCVGPRVTVGLTSQIVNFRGAKRDAGSSYECLSLGRALRGPQSGSKPSGKQEAASAPPMLPMARVCLWPCWGSTPTSR